MDDLEAPIVFGRMWLVLGDFDPAKESARNPKFAVERDSDQVQQKEETK